MNKIHDRLPQVSVFNLYGPTEYTTYTTGTKVSRDRHAPVMLGRPIANTRVYILDESLQPVPVGVAGEVCIAGDGLARGYLHRPDLTTQRFVVARLGGLTLRLYRTGDLAKYAGDGQIEYLGRIDHQVKLRGYRIELGEIESALRACVDVEQAVVVMREDGPGQRHLVAYVTAGAGWDEADVWASLHRTLPRYMHPWAVVNLERMPLTPNGKVDRSNLPAPGRSLLSTSDEPPQTPTEIALAKIWSEVLLVEHIGRHDNFFALGGDSLSIARVRSLWFDLTGQLATIRSLMANQDLKNLATQIDDDLTTCSASAPAAPIPQSEISLEQQPFWNRYLVDPASQAINNIGFAALINGALDLERLHAAIRVVVAVHPMLHSVFREKEGTCVVIEMPASDVTVEVIDWPGAEPLTKLALAHSRYMLDWVSKPFQLHLEPPIRFGLVTSVRDRRTSIIVSANHIAMDHGSQDVLLQQIFENYKNPTESRAAIVDFRHYVRWQYGQRKNHDDQLAEWRRVLTAAPSMQELQSDKFPSEITSWRYPISEDMTEQVSKSCAAIGISTAAYWLSVYYRVLRRHIKTKDMIFGVPSALRNFPGSENMIGPFATLLPVVIRDGNDMNGYDVRRKIARCLEWAVQHQEVPAEEVLRLWITETGDPMAWARANFNHVGNPQRFIKDRKAEFEILPINRVIPKIGINFTVDASKGGSLYLAAVTDKLPNATQIGTEIISMILDDHVG